MGVALRLLISVISSRKQYPVVPDEIHITGDI